MRKSIFVALALAILIVPSVNAVQSIRTIEYPLAYEQYPLANTVYERNITIFPPDGIEEIEALEFMIRGDFLASTQVYGGIIFAEQVYFCNPTDWTSPTWNVDGYEMTFDCTDYVGTWKGHPTIPLQFMWQADQLFGNAKPRVKMTYLNKPKITMNYKVSGTEYEPQQDGMLFLQLLDETNDPVENASCSVSIYYPDGFLKWKDQQEMIESDEGLYFFSFTTPNVEGVYMAAAYCLTPDPASDLYTAEHDFEDNDIAGGTGDWDSNWIETNDCAMPSDGEAYEGSREYRLEHDGGQPYCRRAIESNTSVDRIIVTFYQKAQSLEAGESFQFGVCESGYVNCTDIEEWDDGDDDDVWRLRTYTFLSDDYNMDSNFWIYFDGDGLDAANDELFIDNLEVTARSDASNETEYQEIRGTGEVHVSAEKNYKSELNWGEITNDTFFNYSYMYWDITSYTNVNTSDQPIEINSQHRGFPCTAIYGIYDYNSSSGEYDIPIQYFTFLREDGRCGMRFYHDLNVNEVFTVQVKMESYFKRLMLSQYQQLLFIDEMLNVSCTAYQQGRGYGNFTVPLDTEVPNSTDYLYASCYTFFDNMYLYTTELQTYLFPRLYGTINGTKDVIDTSEERFTSILVTGESLIELSNTIVIGLNLGDSYGISLMQNTSYVPPYSQFYANISSGFLNFQLGNTTLNTLGQSMLADAGYNASLSALIEDINITAENVTATVNETAIAQANWNYENRTVQAYEGKWSGGTEYESGEQGKLAIVLIRTNIFGIPSAVTGATCRATCLYPNGSYFFVNQTAAEQNVSGVYDYDFTVPETEGVYVAGIFCNKSSVNYFATGSFHVNPALNRITSVQSTVNSILSGVNNIREFLDEMVYLITDAFNSAVGIEKEDRQETHMAEEPKAEIHAEEVTEEPQDLGLLILLGASLFAVPICGFFGIKYRRKKNEQIIDGNSIRHKHDDVSESSNGRHTYSNNRQTKLRFQRNAQPDSDVGWRSSRNHHSDTPK